MSTSTINHVLYECAIGYAVFSVVAQTSSIGLKLKEVAETTDDLAKFGKMIKLVNFSPFRDIKDSFENTNLITEGIVPDHMKSILELIMPKGGKNSKITLGVAEKVLGGNIRNMFPGIQVETSDTNTTVQEIMRGIRAHQGHLIPGVKPGEIEQAGLALGHVYSRAKVKFNAARNDVNVMNGLNVVETQDKSLNTWFMRLKEWYGWHFPELLKIAGDNLSYAKLVVMIHDKKSLTDENMEEIAELCDHDVTKAAAIVEAAKVSMGLDLGQHDLSMITEFAKYVVRQHVTRQINATYLENVTRAVAPNLQILVGTTLAARLIEKAGSLVKLAKEPASTLQILGAEKALFRALKTKSNTPKYGIIYHSTFIGRALAKDKGRMSRYLANKCVIAARIDAFSDEPDTRFGHALRKQVEDRLDFFATGKKPATNQEVMDGVAASIKIDVDGNAEDVKIDHDEDDDAFMDDADADATPKKSKKDKKEKKEKSKDKKRKRDSEVGAATPDVNGEEKKKKKKKSKAAAESD